jgi:hypothetical protein
MAHAVLQVVKVTGEAPEFDNEDGNDTCHNGRGDEGKEQAQHQGDKAEYPERN